MHKTKETMAREWVDTNKLGDRSAYEKAFINGFDAGQEQLLEQASWYLSLSPADKKSFGDLIVEVSQAKELIKEMRESLDYYGDTKNWSETGYEDSRSKTEGDGGIRARKTLKENTDKIKDLLGKEESDVWKDSDVMEDHYRATKKVGW